MDKILQVNNIYKINDKAYNYLFVIDYLFTFDDSCYHDY